MKRFRKILVWIEESEEGRVALDQAAAVARETGAALTLAHAVEPPQRVFRALYPQADELHSILTREWEERLESNAATLRAEGLEVSTRLLEGRPFLTFSREVLRAGHDMLVKPADSTEEGPFFGSSDMHLLRKCPCAVWITHPKTPRSSKVLALVDPNPENEEINTRILQMASSLAASRGSTLEALHVWEASGQDLLAKRVQARELEDYVAVAREQSARELEEALADAGVEPSEEHVHLIQGNVRHVVPQFVRRQEVGLIVMGTVCRTGIHGLLIGNTAESILARVQCPVLTVKPLGFHSPVEA